LRIDGPYRPANTGRTAAGRGSGTGSVFQLSVDKGTPQAATAIETTASPAIDSLLALQSVEDPLQAKKRALRRGSALLDMLEAIKTDLLAGSIGEGRLNQLILLIGQARERSEPGLDGLLDDIELRARVELAKAGRFPRF
jgi:Class II flagellar assembly regulator